MKLSVLALAALCFSSLALAETNSATQLQLDRHDDDDDDGNHFFRAGCKGGFNHKHTGVPGDGVDDFTDFLIQGGCGLSFNFEQFNSTNSTDAINGTVSQLVVNVPIAGKNEQYVGGLTDSESASNEIQIGAFVGVAAVGAAVLLF